MKGSKPNEMSHSMEKESTTMSLVKKLIAIRSSLGPVKKDKRNTHFGYNYTSEGQVMALLEPKFTEAGILYTTSVETQEVHYGADVKSGVFVAVTTLHTFHDSETGEVLVLKGAGLGWDSGDKGSYKAQTGATKYNLTKNMMVSDEQDPEAGQERQTEKPAGAKGHSRVKPYEEETGEGDMKVATDLLALKAFLTEHKIPEGFMIRLIQEKGLIDGRTKAASQLQPGILRSCLTDKAKSVLLKAWARHQKDEGNEAQEASETMTEAVRELHATKGKKKGPPEEVRTNEGDQTVNPIRQPVQTDLDPVEALEQDGYTDWRQVPIHFGPQKAATLGKIGAKSLVGWIKSWKPEVFKGTIDEKDILLDSALVLASIEIAGSQ